MKKTYLPFFPFLIGVYAFLYLPIASLILFSFNKGLSLSKWQGFSLMWYAKLFKDFQLYEALWNSIKVATLSATISVLLGFFCALVSVRKRRVLYLDVLSSTPLVLPEVLIGLSFLIFFVTSEFFLGLPRGRGLGTISIAHITVSLAYTTHVLRSRLLEINTNLEEAALDLGAPPFHVFLSITIPFLKPALLAAWFLAFTLSLDDLVIASFSSGPSSITLPVLIFSRVKMGLTPEINALCSLIVLFMLGCAPLASAWFFLSFKRRG